jgi:hypothetical protein
MIDLAITNGLLAGILIQFIFLNISINSISKRK